MPDPYQLLHYSFDGHSLEGNGIHQLENNVTRAFINTFTRVSKHCQHRFLSLLDPKLNRCNLNNIQTGLQRSYRMSGQARTKYLAFLTSELLDLSDSAIEVKSDSRKGRPDAWIHLPEAGIGIAFESKLGKRITKEQLQGHLRALSWRSSVKHCRLTWSTIADAAAEQLQSARGYDKFLLEELINYLEILGMAPFYKWSDADFDALFAEDESYVRILRSRLNVYGQAVRKVLPRSLQKDYPRVYVGNVHLRHRSAWVLIRQPDREKDPLEHCNFSLGVDAEGGWACAVIRNGRVTDKKKALGIFYKALRTYPGEFLKLLRRSAENFKLEISRRSGLDGKGSPRQGAEQWTEVLSIQACSAGEELIPFLLSFLQEVEFPGITFGATYEKSDMLKPSLGKFAKEVARDVEKASVILEFLRKGL